MAHLIHRQAGSGFHVILAREACRHDGHAVIGVPAAQQDAPVRLSLLLSQQPQKLHHRVIRFGSRIREQNPVRLHRGKADDAFGEVERRLRHAAEEGVIGGKLRIGPPVLPR